MCCKKINLLFVQVMFLSACAAGSLNSDFKSNIDYEYKLKKYNNNLVEPKSTTVEFYQKILRPSLYSRCDYRPSDSVYSQIVVKKCGNIVSLFKTFDRFLREPDVGYLGFSMLTHHNEIYFENLPDTCEIF